MSDDVDPSLGDDLYVEVNYDGAAIIIVIGEFDVTGTARFWASVSEALATRPVSMIVEARGLTFIDSSGLSALLGARDAVRPPGGESPGGRVAVEPAGVWLGPWVR